ncbi:UDP-galactose/UDP-glucose transporter 7 [Aplysia californica]|uniref:UDP-galactose/UDP-glucose transporter 7 n=1 Tax=Aplysia californica TaxID=6500 RepID=A0ABM0JVB9_APLCA|nr:UDP-galactose/UDP-glucose transporter 7 [Aplysia californica]
MDKSKTVILEISSEDSRSLETAFKGIVAAVFYGVCSVSSAFVSKALMDTLDFDYPVTIMVAQMIFTIVVLELLSIFRIIELQAFTLKRGLSFAAPSFFYGTNAVLALTALSHMNIAMYGVLKRCVPLSTMLLSVIVLKKGFPSRKTTSAVVLLTTGCVIAGYGDLGFNLTAYICGIGSNFTQALYLLLVQKFSERHVSVVETLQLNSFNTLPLLTLVALVNGELFAVHSYPKLTELQFLLMFFMAISVGMLLNYSLFLCTSLTSALTTSVVGGLKALVQTLLGLVTFGGVSHNMATFVGISMNLSGGIGYIWARYTENKSGLQSLKKVMSFSQIGNSGLSNGQVQNVERNGYQGDEIMSHRSIATPSSNSEES